MRLLFALLALALMPALVAQSSWTAVPSPTRHTLWGVCHAAGQFVAVGENGTILTSPDGLTWTPRQSGTTAWLTSVARGPGSFLAVGDHGTVLRSPDALTWENVSAGADRPPTTRLNVAHFARGGFLIYGEQDSAYFLNYPNRFNSSSNQQLARPWWRSVARGFDRTVIGGETGLSVVRPGFELSPSSTEALRITDVRNISGVVFFREAFTAVGAAGGIVTSTDALNWSRQSSDTTANLHALAPFNNTLVAAGDDGTILSQDELGVWRRRSSPTTELLLGIAASDTVAVIVGANGTLLRATPTPMPPTLITSPASVTETLGGAASFIVRANGSLPLSYQWHRNGIALPGETHETLTRSPLTGTDAGSYTVTVSNSAGSVTSPVATLNLLPAPAPIVDETFRADATLDGNVTALLPFPDGSVLVATAGESRIDGIACRLRKLRSDGSLDSSWTESVFAVADPNSSFATIRVLLLQPDGKILVGGTFSTHNDQTRPNLLRLQPDGSLDATFVAAQEAAARPILEVVLQPDGRILVANRGIVPLRLLPNGALDPEFRPAPLPPVPLFNRPDQLRERFVEHVAFANGKIYFSGTANLQITLIQGFVPDTMLVRVDANGAVDPTFATQQWSGSLLALRALDDGSVLLVRDNKLAGIGFPYDTFAVRLTSTGTPFPGYRDPKISSRHFIYPDGRLLYFDTAVSGLVRLTASGAPDSTFTGGIGTPSAIALTADSRILVGGSFTLYNAQPANRVARLHSVRNESVNPPRVLALTADKLTVRVGEPVVVRAAVTGSAELTYDWSIDSGGAIRTASPTFTFSAAHYNAGSSTLRLTVRNPRGEATTAPLTFTILPDAPILTSQPSPRISTQSGRDVLLRIERNSDAGPTAAEWRHNGQLLPRTGEPWEDGQTLSLRAVTPAQAGTYTLTLRNQLGATITSAPIVLAIDETSRLANLSTRAHVGPGRPLIAGFTLGGSEHDRHQILLRGVGRGLARFDIADFLADPQALLFSGNVQSHAGNLDWDNTSPEHIETLRTTFARVGAFPLELGSKDAASVATLTPGGYTVHVTDQTGGAGTALVELYEADNDAAPLVNLSTRATVGPATPVIAGFSIQGPVSKRLLLRAAGPALNTFGVADALANPRLELKDESGRTVATNDDWSTGDAVAALEATAHAVGAFPFARTSRDAALLVTLPPGNYTAHLTSADTSTGTALIEVYEVPELR